MIPHLAKTHVGLRRKDNQDAVYTDSEIGLFLLADGVGGHLDGDVAAATAIKTFENAKPEILALRQSADAISKNQLRRDVLTLLEQLFQRASQAVFDESERRDQNGMLTTLVVSFVVKGDLYVGHVGDSRAYLHRNGQLRQVTEDHSMVNELVKMGRMSLEDARKSRYRNLITRAIGLKPTVQPDIIYIPILDGDTILMCSDGLSDPVPENVIETALKAEKVEECAEELFQAALDKGGPDNIGIVLFKPSFGTEPARVSSRAQAMDSLFLFRDLNYPERMKLSRICDDLDFNAGDVLVREDEVGDSLYVITSGKVLVRSGNMALAELESGQHFGELGPLEYTSRSATVEAISKGSVIIIRYESLQQFYAQDPELGCKILQRMLSTAGNRLRSVNKKLLSIQRALNG
ncbi:MAG: cyclic nucleotide-binding domain-containing protein [Myxococcota bacterium]